MTAREPEPPSITDPIDWIRHYWPNDLGEPERFLAMGSVLRLHELMLATMESTLKPLGLTRNGYLLLATVRFSKRGSKLLSRVASQMLLHPTSVTSLADRLEGQGLVERTPHPTDRRATFLVITPAGKALLKKATAALDAVDFGLPGLTTREARKIIELLAPIRTAAGDAGSGD